jgi:DNA-directed RNA polymerase subunit RPC12/RpoP
VTTQQPAEQLLLCLYCRAVILVDPETPLSACPKCGSRNVPADLADTVTVTITTHELRVLTMWASNWADHIKDMPNCDHAPKVITGILDEIGKATSAPLSMRQEIADLRAEFGEVRVYGADGTERDL